MSISDLHFYLIPKKEVVDKEPSIEFMSISLGTQLGEEIARLVPRDGRKHIFTTDMSYEITMSLEHTLRETERELEVLSSFLKCAEIHNLESMDAYFEDFKDKSEEIINFFLSRNIILIITLSKVITLELLSLKIIDIIDNINTMSKLLSFNFCDFISYVKLNDKKHAFVKYY